MPRNRDPLHRARNFTRMPSPRREFQSQEARMRRMESATGVALQIATQPSGNALVETVYALPEPTPHDLGRLIMVRLTGQTTSLPYIGALGADNVVIWQRLGMAGESFEGSEGFAFVSNFLTTQGGGWEALGTNGSAYLFAVASGLPGELWTRRHADNVEFYFGFYSGAATDVVFNGEGDYYLAQPSLNRVARVPWGTGSYPFTPNYTTSPQAYNALAHRPGTPNLYATATNTNSFYKLNMSSLAVESTVSGLSTPRAIAVDSSDNVYVVNGGTTKIRRYNSSLAFVSEWGVSGSGDGQLNDPRGIAIDGIDRIYIADSGNHRVQIFDATGTFLGKFGSFGTGIGQFQGPRDVFVFGSSIFVADTGNARVSEWERT
jgi:hypothetical protein